MSARRTVEEFGRGEWKDNHEYDGRAYCTRIKVNREEEQFNTQVHFSGVVLATQADALERGLNDEDREAMAEVKIKKEVRNGCLDGWPPTKVFTLDIDCREVDDLVFEAKREGKVTP